MLLLLPSIEGLMTRGLLIVLPAGESTPFDPLPSALPAHVGWDMGSAGSEGLIVRDSAELFTCSTWDKAGGCKAREEVAKAWALFACISATVFANRDRA